MLWHVKSIDRKNKLRLFEWLSLPIEYESKYFRLVNVPKYLAISSGLTQDMGKNAYFS